MSNTWKAHNIYYVEWKEGRKVPRRTGTDSVCLRRVHCVWGGFTWTIAFQIFNKIIYKNGVNSFRLLELNLMKFFGSVTRVTFMGLRNFWLCVQVTVGIFFSFLTSHLFTILLPSYISRGTCLTFKKKFVKLYTNYTVFYLKRLKANP